MQGPSEQETSDGISILDLGIGNIGSIRNMLQRIGSAPHVVTTAQQALSANKLIVPGVGHWDNAARRIDAELREVLQELAFVRRIPILGICLGMQLMFSSSEEGTLPGLGWVPGEVKRFRFETSSQTRQKVPHMGWNAVHAAPEREMNRELPPDVRFYFAHSYHAAEVDREDVSMVCAYGYEFACGIQRANLWGVQFHPEKSHRFGMRLMSNFADGLPC